MQPNVNKTYLIHYENKKDNARVSTEAKYKSRNKSK